MGRTGEKSHSVTPYRIIEKFAKTGKNGKLANFVMIMMFVLAIIASSICVKRYFFNSNVISYDMSSFTIYNGFDSSVSDNSLIITPIENESENTERPMPQTFCADSSNILLSEGEYMVSIAYESDGYNKAYFSAGDSVYEEIMLPAGNQAVSYRFELKQAVEDARLRIFYNEGHYFKVNTMLMESSDPIVSDWILIFALIWAILLSAEMYLKFFLEGNLTKQHLIEIGFVIVVALASIPLIELFTEGIFWGTDTNANNMRIEGVKDALLGGQFPVVIAPSMCNGYGSIEPMMYPSLFLYPFAILRILKVSPVLVYKFAHVIINLFMCSTCYVCVKKITRSCKASAIALITFAFSKYHLMMMGSSDWAYGMGIALIFLFMAIIGIYEIFIGKKEEWPYLTFGMWGLMNSHILSTLMAAGIVAVFTMVYFKKLVKEERLRSLLLAAVTAVPLCLYRIYTFLDAMLSNELNTSSLNIHVYDAHAYTVRKLIERPLTVLAMVMIAVTIVYIVFRMRKLTDRNVFLITSFGIALICFAAMLKYWPWEKVFGIKAFDLLFGYIQYPNRMMQVGLPMFIVVIGMVSARLINEKTIFSKGLLSIILVSVAVISVWSYDNDMKAIKKQDIAFSGKVTGDVVSFPGMCDYAPIDENIESFSGKTPYYSSGDITIDEKSYEKNGVNVFAEVSAKGNGNYVDFPVFGYKGYKCVDEDGKEYKTGIGKHHRLRVYIDDTNGKAVFLKISYKVSWIYYILIVISYASLVAIVTMNRSFLGRIKSRTYYYERLKAIPGVKAILDRREEMV